MIKTHLITLVAILLVAQAMTTGAARGDTVLLQDDFGDNSIDASKWMTSGVQVQETGGIMRVLTAATDNGGVLVSQPFNLASRGVITITRSVCLHHANDYFCGYIAVRFGGLPWAAVDYADHSYTNTNWLQRFGIYLDQNIGTPDSAWSHAIARSNAAITGPYSAVLWDTWFNEKIVYTPDTGIMECYINSQKLGEQFIGIMPSTDSTMQLGFRAWGWYTGHYENIDNVVVSQSTQPVTPVTIKVDTPIMGSTRAFLEWDAYGAFDEYRYRIYVEKHMLLYSTTLRIINYDEDGEEIRNSKAIVNDLESGSTYYLFWVAAVDSEGIEVATSKDQPVKGTIKPVNQNKIPAPANPIVLVPGVGSKLGEQKHFDTLKQYFSELGWSSAPEATVSYGNILQCPLYVKGTIPSGVTWAASTPDVTKYNVFTFVPFVPDWIDPTDNQTAHEIGIEQKGIELGYFLSELNNQGAGNFQLIGHSLGGLTCRAYIQRVKAPLTYSNNVVRLVTTGTPNNGVMPDHEYYEDNYSLEGVKDILLHGYIKENWRSKVFEDNFWDQKRLEDYLTGFVNYLENGATCFYHSGGGWDFEGQTLMKDVMCFSDFMDDLRNPFSGIYRDLPNIKYVSLIGEVKSFGKPHWLAGGCTEINDDMWRPGGNNSYLGYSDRDGDHYENGDSDGSILDGGDGVVSTYSQNLTNVTNREVQVIERNKNHLEEGDDCIGMLLGLDYPVLTFRLNCPVDLKVTAPSGQYMAKGDSAMFLATYREIEDANSPTPHKVVEIPFPEDGNYTIEVIANPNADLNATYSLIATRGDTTTVLADNVKIGDIPQEPYQAAGDTAPMANAGPVQTVYAWIDGIADVNLDGSASYDADGDTLTYKWSWIIDGNTYDTNGVKPTIELPVGQHVISLVVNDGIVDSEPNEVNITVVGPVEANLCVTPKVLNSKSFMPRIMATLRLPRGITKDQIASNEPILLYPGQIEADWTWISRDFDYKCRAWNTTILASFDKDELMAAIPNNGQVELVVVGQLKTGQYFFGTDNIRVISPGTWPHHKPWWNCRWNRWCQRPFNCRH